MTAEDTLIKIREIADGRRHYDGAEGYDCFTALGEIRDLCDKAGATGAATVRSLVDALTQDRETPNVAFAAVHAILTYELKAAINRPTRNKMFEHRLHEAIVATGYAMQFVFTKPDGSSQLWPDIEMRAKKVLGLSVELGKD